jgi:hypothetical protein
VKARRVSTRYEIEPPAFTWVELIRGLVLFTVVGGMWWLSQFMGRH